MKSPRFLEYIESTGNQYIDTGIQITGQTALNISAKITQTTTNYDTLFGTRNGNGYRYTARFGNSVSGELQMQFSCGNNYSTAYSYWNTGVRKNGVDGYISLYMDGSIQSFVRDPYAHASVYYTQGGELKSAGHDFSSGNSASYPASLYLFALHDAQNGVLDFAYMRLQSCTIYGRVRAHKDGDSDNSYTLFEVPVRDFFPALDEDGRPCLYDAISDEYFYSPNGEAFVAGPQIDRMLFRVFSRDQGYTPEYRIRSIQAVSVPQNSYYATETNGNPNEDIYEFVGYDTDPAAFTAVYATRDYRDTGIELPASYANRIEDVYAVFKSLCGYLVKDGNGVFYTLNRDGTRRNLGEQELCANLFRDYAFQGYPGADTLSDLLSPSIYNWTKKSWEDDEHNIHYYAPAVFDATVWAIPPLPQVIVFPTITLRKPLAYVTIPGDDTTLWNVSFDGGTTWYKYENAWIAVAEDGDGSIKRKFEILDNGDWTPMLTNGTIKFRAWVRRDGWVSSIRNEYTEGENE